MGKGWLLAEWPGERTDDRAPIAGHAVIGVSMETAYPAGGRRAEGLGHRLAYALHQLLHADFECTLTPFTFQD